MAFDWIPEQKKIRRDTLGDTLEKTPGYGEHFLKFCPKYCPCEYPCTTVIGEDFKWRCPPMHITGIEWNGDQVKRKTKSTGKSHE